MVLKWILARVLASHALGSISAHKASLLQSLLDSQRPVSKETGARRDFLSHARALPPRAGSPVSNSGYQRVGTSWRVSVSGPRRLRE